MVNEVNKIVYNTLVAERAIHLPGVGTLSIVRKSAEVASGGMVLPPSHSVQFSSSAHATSLVDAIAREAGVDSASAEELYSRWLEKVRVGSTLTIEGVGRLQQKNFVAEGEFVALFNRAVAPVKIKRHNKSAISAALIASFIGVGVVFGAAAWFFVNDTPEPDNEIVKQQDVVAVTNVADKEEVIIEEVVEEVAPEEPIEVAEPEVSETATNWTQATDIHHWVVAGSYSTEQNAETAKNALMATHNEISCDIISLGKMYAVAVYGSTNRDDCVEFMREHSAELKNLWIFTPKKFK